MAGRADEIQTDYSWQSSNSLKDKRENTDKRREELLQLMYSSSAGEVEDEKLIKEWIALVTERDVILKETIDKENCETKEFYVHSLKKVLNQAPMEVFLPDTKDSNLKKLLHELRTQVTDYCEQQGIKSPAPAVPPLAPPPPVIKLHTSKCDEVQLRDNSRLRDLNKSKPSHKPLNGVNSLLIHDILNTGNRKLRPTGFQHSPGGTPMKRRRRLSLSDQADLLQLALEKKFQNTVASPIRVHSPASFSVSTPNLASHGAAPDPGLTTDSLSEIWSDTPSALMVQDECSKNDTAGSTAV